MLWIRKNLLVFVFVAVNGIIATPAQAGVQDATCLDEAGMPYGCCETCWAFCGCQYDE